MAKKKAKKKKNTYATDARIISDRMVLFTQELAEWYVALPKFDGERGINQAKAEALRDQMHTDKWSEGHGEISVAQFPNGDIHRLNGQHRCWARFLLEDPNFKPKMRLVKYEVKDADDYRKLYIRFDNPSTHQVRSRAHLIQMALFGTDEFEGITKRTCSSVAQGYKFWAYGCGNAARKITIEQLCDELREGCNTRARHVAEIIGAVVSNSRVLTHMARAPVYGAIFETFKYPTRARKFWTSVSDGLFDRKSDPAKILSDYLQRTGLGNKIRTRQVTKLVTQSEMYAVCVKCFNFFSAGKGLSKTPPSTGPRPIARA